jgi:hypothetical protein
MPVPGKHDDEPRTEIQAELYEKWLDARDQAMSWGRLAADYRDQLEAQLGENTGGTIHGRLVVTYRGKERYAVASIVRDNPALTEHYMKTREIRELDIDTFAKVHQDIAEKYRIREFRIAGGGDEDVV